MVVFTSKLGSGFSQSRFLMSVCHGYRQWLPRNKLEPLGIASDVDQAKLTESRKPADRKAVRKAYQEAMLHRCQVSEGQGKRSRAASIGNADLLAPAEEN
jgi:hypothetical protein